ncbi:MFS transporter [soil metagenome]
MPYSLAVAQREASTISICERRELFHLLRPRFRDAILKAMNKDFLKLWSAQIGSAFGSRLTRTALPVLAILTIKASPAEIAILGALSVAPGVLVGLFAGGPVDRGRKRPLLVWADLVRAVLILTVPAVALLGPVSMLHLYLVAGMVGAATSLFQIADRSFLPLIVPTDRLVAANARLQATESIAEAAGPGAAGILIQIVGAPIALAVDAVTYLWSALMLSRIKTVERPAEAEPAPAHVLSDISAGLRAVHADPVIGPTLIADGVIYLAGGYYVALYMVLALKSLGLSPAVTGLIITLGGFGAFVGSLIAPRMARLVGAGPAMVLALAIGQAGNLAIPLTLTFPKFAIPLLCVQQILADAFATAYVIHAISLRQRLMPEAVLGRANAAFQVVVGLMLPLGALIAAPLSETIGVGPCLWIAAGGGLLAAPVLLRSAILKLR